MSNYSSSLQRMVSILNDTAFYNISPSSVIFAELSAYSSIIEDIIANINTTISEIFFESLSAKSEYLYDHLFQIGNPNISAHQRADLYSSRLAISTNYFSHKDVKSAIASGGITVNFIESPHNATLTVQVINDIGIFESPNDREIFIKKFLPAYLKPTFIHLISE